MNDEILEGFPIVDAIDHEILMHRDAHFGGQFSVMIDYYKQEGKGVQPEFSIQRIEELAAIEGQLHQNLAALFLTANEAEKIAESRKVYKALRDLYEIEKPKSIYPRLIADLILSDEEDPETEIHAIISEKSAIVPHLIELLKTESFYDPLFPGYGIAPSLAVKCLGLIGDKRAIITLFEAFGQSDFFSDEQILKALKEIGEPAKQFLLKVVSGHPINEDNERAAIALIQFKEDPEVAAACFSLLQDDDVQADPCLPIYLVLACEGLKDPVQRKMFTEMSKDQRISKTMREDMKAVIHSWNIG